MWRRPSSSLASRYCSSSSGLGKKRSARQVERSSDALAGVVVVLVLLLLVGSCWLTLHLDTAKQGRIEVPRITASPIPAVAAPPTQRSQPAPKRVKPEFVRPSEPEQAQKRTTVTIGGDVKQGGDGGCQQNIIGGNGNNINCAPVAQVSASTQSHSVTADINGLFETRFTITTNVLVQTGDLRLQVVAGRNGWHQSHKPGESDYRELTVPTQMIGTRSSTSLALRCCRRVKRLRLPFPPRAGHRVLEARARINSGLSVGGARLFRMPDVGSTRPIRKAHHSGLAQRKSVTAVHRSPEVGLG